MKLALKYVLKFRVFNLTFTYYIVMMCITEIMVIEAKDCKTVTLSLFLRLL